jgi:FkbM family methyltransferase
MRALIRNLKSALWWCLARLLSTGAVLLRRRPGPTTSDEWRAAEMSYSHFGEDLIVLRLLRENAASQNKGFYVDVGAFDPVFFSNTLLLHKHGWKGINIDANPERVELLRQRRPTDINVCAVVSNSHRSVRYLRYPTEGLNRIVDATAGDTGNMQGESPIASEEMTTCTLGELLERHVPPGTGIDFLNVDCEGEDLNVLDGLDWEKWRPRIVAVEANTPPERERLLDFMQVRGYALAAQVLVTFIFADGQETRQASQGISSACAEVTH